MFHSSASPATDSDFAAPAVLIPGRSAAAVLMSWSLPLAGVAAGLAVTGLFLREGARPAPVLQAAGHAVASDFDGDGLEDGAELVFRTFDYSPDSDGDGYSDSEELARDSDPLDGLAVPSGAAPQAGLDASAHDELLHLVSTFYVETSDLADYDMQIGAVLGGRLVFLSPRSISAQISSEIVPAADPGYSVVVVDVVVRPRIVFLFGSVPFLTTLIHNGAVVAAEKVDLEAVEGILMRRVEIPLYQTPALAASALGPQITTVNSSNSGSSSAQTGSSHEAGGPWSFYQPINGESGGLQSNGVTGAVCVQKTEIVGGVGGAVTHEVVEAGCQEGWDGFCSDSCSGTVGTTYVSVDPGALIGG